MNTFTRIVIGGTLFVVAGVLLLTFLATAGPKSSNAQAVGTSDKTYIGAKSCAACHFPQFRTWKKDRHAKSFEILPEKYKQDAACLKCHTTAFGEPSGYKDETTAGLAGTTCEACHGPGSEHSAIAQRFVEEEMTPEGEQQLRAAILKIDPENACIQCHLNKAHKDPHPEYDKE